MVPPDPGACEKNSTRDVDTRNSRFDVGLDVTLLASEARPCPEADIFCKAGPHKSGGQQPPRSLNTRVQELVERHDQSMAERNWNKWPLRSKDTSQ